MFLASRRPRPLTRLLENGSSHSPRRRRFLFARAVSGFSPRGQLSPLEVALISILARPFLSPDILGAFSKSYAYSRLYNTPI